MNRNSWLIVRREKASAQDNMAMDSMLLRRLSCLQQPVLHLYEWEAPSITHGYFVNPEQHLNMTGVGALGVQVARRPTGGGVIVHTTDLAFSVLLPASHPSFATNTLENYAFINTIVAQVIKPFLPSSHLPSLLPSNRCPSEDRAPFCMAEPTVFDVMIEGKKVAGGAQRRTKHGYLHQGSISLGVPEESFLAQVLQSKSVCDLMHKNTYPLMGTGASVSDIPSLRKEISVALHHTLEKFS